MRRGYLFPYCVIYDSIFVGRSFKRFGENIFETRLFWVGEFVGSASGPNFPCI